MPAILISWQGKPNVQRSAFGKSFPLTFVTSLPNHRLSVLYIALYDA
nr:MAG TPA: hypothetical protein [Caudoviricetes sp.]